MPIPSVVEPVLILSNWFTGAEQKFEWPTDFWTVLPTGFVYFFFFYCCGVIDWGGTSNKWPFQAKANKQIYISLLSNSLYDKHISWPFEMFYEDDILKFLSQKFQKTNSFGSPCWWYMYSRSFEKLHFIHHMIIYDDGSCSALIGWLIYFASFLSNGWHLC